MGRIFSPFSALPPAASIFFSLQGSFVVVLHNLAQVGEGGGKEEVYKNFRVYQCFELGKLKSFRERRNDGGTLGQIIWDMCVRN